MLKIMERELLKFLTNWVPLTSLNKKHDFTEWSGHFLVAKYERFPFPLFFQLFHFLSMSSSLNIGTAAERGNTILPSFVLNKLSPEQSEK